MYKNICFLLLIFNTTSCIYGQELNIPRFLDSIAKKVHFYKYTPIEADDSLICGGFNFKTFRPEKLNGNTYKLLYKKGKLKQIVSNNGTNSYNAYFFHFPKWIAYTICFNSNKSSSFARGIFVYDIRWKKNWFWSLEQDAFARLTSNEIQGKSWFDLIDTSIDHINVIFELNHTLLPITRVNCYDSEILSFSEIKYDKEIIREKLFIPARQTCNYKLNLSSLSISEFYWLVTDDGCEDGISVEITHKNSNLKLPLGGKSDFTYNSIQN